MAFPEEAPVTILRRYVDWRAIAALAGIGLGTAIFARQTLGVTLPVHLFLAACPLPMALMVVIVERGARDGSR